MHAGKSGADRRDAGIPSHSQYAVRTDRVAQLRTNVLGGSILDPLGFTDPFIQKIIMVRTDQLKK